MNINDIKRDFKAGKLTDEEAIRLLGPHFDSSDPVRVQRAMRLLDHIMEMPSEPQKMSEAEREAAARWEKNYRGG